MRFVARHGGDEFPIEVVREGSGYRVRLGDRWLAADLINAGPYVRSLRLEDGTQLAIVHDREGTMHEIALPDSTIHVDIANPLSPRRKQREDEVGGGGAVRAPMPGRIVRVMVQNGEAVHKGTSLLVLEAMKMENDLQAPVDGVVAEVLVEPGQAVEGGAELVRISPR